MWKYYALLAAFFAALTALLAKAGVKGINSNLATAIRTSVVLLLAWGLVFAAGSEAQWKELTRRNLVFLLLSGLATGASWLFYFKALEVGAVSRVAAVDKLSVVFTILLGWLILGESMSATVALGAALILAGSLVILWGT